MIVYLELYRDIFGHKKKVYRTTGFVFRQPAIGGKIYFSVRLLKQKTLECQFFRPFDVIKGVRDSYKHSIWTIRYSLILKELSLLLSNAVGFLLCLKIRNSPSLFSYLRNKLKPMNDGKTDSVVYESNDFLSFLYSNCRNHFYGESKNFVGSGREKFEVGHLGVKIG